jgi:hypothetical protein
MDSKTGTQTALKYKRIKWHAQTGLHALTPSAIEYKEEKW